MVMNFFLSALGILGRVWFGKAERFLERGDEPKGRVFLFTSFILIYINARIPNIKFRYPFKPSTSCSPYLFYRTCISNRWSDKGKFPGIEKCARGFAARPGNNSRAGSRSAEQSDSVFIIYGSVCAKESRLPWTQLFPAIIAVTGSLPASSVLCDYEPCPKLLRETPYRGCFLFSTPHSLPTFSGPLFPYRLTNGLRDA